jgi:Autotransporter beta-domain
MRCGLPIGLTETVVVHRVNTDYLFGGVYSRFEWAARFFDFTVQGGNTSNKSQRTVLNNLAPETARANYNGWFVSTVLIGQNVSFATPGKGSTVGVVAGAGFDYHVRANVAVFGAVEGMTMSDQSRLGTAKGGVRVAF